jgi:hypothetical protein
LSGIEFVKRRLYLVNQRVLLKVEDRIEEKAHADPPQRVLASEDDIVYSYIDQSNREQVKRIIAPAEFQTGAKTEYDSDSDTNTE